MPYRSKAQERKFFADPRLRKYAHKWAHESGQKHGKKGSVQAFRRLPEHVKKKRKRKR
jgi:hypothetical protein